MTVRVLRGDCRTILPTLPANSVHSVADSNVIRYNFGMKNIPIDVLAYAAGVIDSDGSIGIRRSTYAKRVRGDARNPIYSTRVCVKQVERDAVALLKDSFGGALMVERSTLKNGRPFYYWEIHSRQATAMLRALLPYLRIKRRQAENCLALYALIDGAMRTKVLGTRLLPHWTGKAVMVRTMGHTDEHVAACEALYLKAKQLNVVGMKGGPDERQTTDRGCTRDTANAA